MAMEQGEPIIGQDAAVFLDRTTKQSTIYFKWLNHDIFTEVDVYLIRNDKSKKLVSGDITPGDPMPSQPNIITYVNANGIITSVTPGRFVAVPGTIYTVTYTFTKQEHFDPFNFKYPVFKFRIEMVGNVSIYAETNDFKVVY